MKKVLCKRNKKLAYAKLEKVPSQLIKKLRNPPGSNKVDIVVLDDMDIGQDREVYRTVNKFAAVDHSKKNVLIFIVCHNPFNKDMFDARENASYYILFPSKNQQAMGHLLNKWFSDKERVEVKSALKEGPLIIDTKSHLHPQVYDETGNLIELR